MTWEKLDKIMRYDGAYLYASAFGWEVFDPTWGTSRFRKVHPKVGKAWLKRDLGVISEQDSLSVTYRHKYT